MFKYRELVPRKKNSIFLLRIKIFICNCLLFLNFSRLCFHYCFKDILIKRKAEILL